MDEVCLAIQIAFFVPLAAQLASRGSKQNIKVFVIAMSKFVSAVIHANLVLDPTGSQLKL